MYKKDSMIKISINNNSAYIEIPFSFAYKDSEKAVKRKIKRMAKFLKLREDFFPMHYECVSRKDEKRLVELLRYCNGSAMRKTARNNYGRSNANR
nr:MAG TPA: hypothetical protein [Caudoviricetes sp.]